MLNKDKSETTQIEMNPHIYVQLNPHSDQRVKMIYDRYRTGRSIIMDDLRYLWLKDPEGCEKLSRRIVDSISGHVQATQSNNLVSIGYVRRDIESTQEEQNKMDDKSSSNTTIDTLKDILETMTTVKVMIEKMNETERTDMLNHLNNEIELKKLTNKIKYWDDTYVDKLLTYQYDVEKEFDKLA